MYSKQFWMFCLLLLVITLTSSVGGGIRFRENFLEEVFDLNDITSELDGTTSFYSPIDLKDVSEETDAVPKKIEEENSVNVPIELPVVNSVDKLQSQYEIIEAYTGEAYAAF